MNGKKLIVFLKAPRPGKVKTRLAQAIGPVAACAVYRKLVEHLLSNLDAFPRVQLSFTPKDAFRDIQLWLRPSWSARPQSDGDLGRRMQDAFLEAFDEGARRVVIIGSDCPAITKRDIDQAWAALTQVELVLGPAQDGGYWLIGLRQPQPRLFVDIPWSTGAVLVQTLQRAHDLGLTVRQLSEKTDVDTKQDWDAFRKEHPLARFSLG